MLKLKRLLLNLLLAASLCVSMTTVAFPTISSASSTSSSAYSGHWYAPIWALGPKARTFFTCVIHVESRSTWTHPNTHDGDPALPGQYGIFQFTWPSQNNAWDAYIFPKLHVEPRYASAYQQAEGAAIMWKIGDAYQTWTLWDGCRV